MHLKRMTPEQAVQSLGNEEIKAPEAVEAFRRLLNFKAFHTPSGEIRETTDLVASVLHADPELTSQDSLLPRRLACAVVLNGMRRDARNSETAFAPVYKRDVIMILQAGKKLVEKIYAASEADGLIITPGKEYQVDVGAVEAASGHKLDRFYVNFSRELEVFSNAAMAVVDLARSRTLYNSMTGVLVERLLLVFEEKQSLAAVLAHEGVNLGRAFIEESMEIYRCRRDDWGRFAGRAIQGSRAGLRNEPYYSDADDHVRIAPASDPVRFSHRNRQWPPFQKAAEVMPRLIEAMN